MVHNKCVLLLSALLATVGSFSPTIMVIESDNVEAELEVFYVTEPSVSKSRDTFYKHKDADIKLRCNELKDKGTNDIMWQYKRCGYALSLTACEDLPVSVPWQRVKCRNGTKFCEGVTLPITKPNELDSGIYRCLYKNYMEQQRYKVYRIIQLEVRDPLTKSMEILPEEPGVDNQTVFENQTAVLRCRVRSLVYPHIVWARYASTPIISAAVSIGGVLYQFLNASQPHDGADKTYTSKLYLNHVKLNDAGQYVCFALDGRHNLSKIVSLDVVPLLSHYRDTSTVNIEFCWIAVALVVSGISCILVGCFLFRRMQSKMVEVPNEDVEEKLSVRPLC